MGGRQKRNPLANTGVAMGSPLGPVLANIFMCHFEEKWILNNNNDNDSDSDSDNDDDDDNDNDNNLFASIVYFT